MHTCLHMHGHVCMSWEDGQKEVEEQGRAELQ